MISRFDFNIQLRALFWISHSDVPELDRNTWNRFAADRVRFYMSAPDRIQSALFTAAQAQGKGRRL